MSGVEGDSPLFEKRIPPLTRAPHGSGDQNAAPLGHRKESIMRAVLTKVKHASVTIDGELKGKIGRGFLILLGVAPDDTEEKCRKMADKLCSLRIFDDENAARSAVAALKNGYKQVYLCKPTHGGPRVTVRRLFGAKK